MGTNGLHTGPVAAVAALPGSGVQRVVFRTGHVIGPPAAPGPTSSSLLARGGRVSVLGDGRQRVAPILLDDAVATGGVQATADAFGLQLHDIRHTWASGPPVPANQP